MNSKVINGLKSLRDDTKDPYRKIAYNNAIKTIESMTFTIENVSQLKGTTTARILSKKMCDKIAFILTQPDNAYDGGCDLTSVWGIGDKMAERLKAQNVLCISDLRARVLVEPSIVPDSVLVTLKYHEQLQQKMPRNVITSVVSIVSKKLPGFIIETCGSYRRGLSVSGDMDLLITRNDLLCTDDLEKKNVMADIILGLASAGLIIAVLSSKYKKAMCVCNYKGVVFHLDIRVVLQDHFPFALLYFTGSKKMNTVMRQKAIDLGYKLNEYCLTDIKTGGVLHLKTEKDIFERLLMDYKDPCDRSLL